MINPFLKPFRWAIFYTICLISFTVFVLIDTFVIPHEFISLADSQSSTLVSSTVESTDTTVASESTEPSKSSALTESSTMNVSVAATDSNDTADISSSSYRDDNIQIQIDEVSDNGVVYYVADVVISDPSLLKTALAEDSYGKNITAPTSEIASDHQAIFAINGDYYGFRDEGYVMRNGQLLRSVANSADTEALVIDTEGNLKIVYESEVSAQTLEEQGAWQILSFGPALVIDGETVLRNTKNGSKDNPRTAIGQVEEGHYVFVVVDGRTAASDGVTLEELAEIMKKYGCETAYNLDGGGTATMWFNGNVINNPTDGKKVGERNVSDIVMIGY